MTTSSSAASGGSLGVLDVLTVLVGAMVAGYGLLLVPQSVLGGGWVAAIGCSMALSGLFSTEWAGDRFDLSASGRRRASLAFGALAALLLVAFFVVNGGSFESGVVEGSG